MTDIYLLRHAETDRGKGLCIGRSENGLSKTGRNRAAVLACWMKENIPDIAEIHTSPLQRAVDTAGIIARRYSLICQIDSALAAIVIYTASSALMKSLEIGTRKKKVSTVIRHMTTAPEIAAPVKRDFAPLSSFSP